MSASAGVIEMRRAWIAFVGAVLAVGFATVPVVHAAPVTAQSDAHLVGTYHLDENRGTVLVDASGNGAHGVITDGVWTPSGRFGSALDFGSGLSAPWASFPSVFPFHDPAVGGSPAATLSFWVKPVDGQHRTLFWTREGPGTPDANRFHIYSGSASGENPAGMAMLGVDYRSVDGTLVLLFEQPVWLDQWTNVVMTRTAAASGFHYALYLNGILDATRDDNGELPTSQTWSLGRMDGGLETFRFNGILDEINLWDRALSPDEVHTQFLHAPTERIFGQDAIDTSLAISHSEFPQNGSATAVLLARSDHFADALAGGPLAAARNAPLLITPGASLSSTLDPRVLAEIGRVLPVGHTVFVLGGTLALAPGIDTTLTSLGYTVVRVFGSNQYATAVAIAGELGNPSVIFEATGHDFADALSAVPAVIVSHGAILLTDGTTQAPETAAYLAAHPPTTRYAIGGPLAAAGADPTATPIYGQDLFETSAAVAETFFPTPSTFGAATGLHFPDALSGGVFMGTPGRTGPVLLVMTSLPIPPSVDTYLATHITTLTHGFVFGGPLAVGDDVLHAL